MQARNNGYSKNSMFYQPLRHFFFLFLFSVLLSTSCFFGGNFRTIDEFYRGSRANVHEGTVPGFDLVKIKNKRFKVEILDEREVKERRQVKDVVPFGRVDVASPDLPQNLVPQLKRVISGVSMEGKKHLLFKVKVIQAKQWLKAMGNGKKEAVYVEINLEIIDIVANKRTDSVVGTAGAENTARRLSYTRIDDMYRTAFTIAFKHALSQSKFRK